MTASAALWEGLLLPGYAEPPDLRTLAKDLEQRALVDRRWFHENAELSLREGETRAYLLEALEAIPGVRLIEGNWGTGVIALLEGHQPGPLVAWRTDMDALPITETTGLPFACTKTDSASGQRTVGVMHACGHDMHMSIALGLMRVLSQIRHELPGSVLLICEPGEEIGAGALQLLEAGLFDEGRLPKCVLALHVHPTLEFGTVGSCPGWATGNVDGFLLLVKGQGGHGAYPHRAVDPVTLAARMVLAFQSVVSREINVMNHAVISVGRIEGGTASNVIPSEVNIHATVRTHDDETRSLLQQKIERTVLGLAQAAGAPEPELEYYFGTPAGYNDPNLVEQVRQVFRDRLGPEADMQYEPSLGGEDFSRYGRLVPGFQFRLGVARPESPPMSLHQPNFNPDERALTLGIELAAAVILDQLQRGE